MILSMQDAFSRIHWDHRWESIHSGVYTTGLCNFCFRRIRSVVLENIYHVTHSALSMVCLWLDAPSRIWDFFGGNQQHTDMHCFVHRCFNRTT